MVRGSNTQKTILNLAEALLQDKGYNGFSYAHISTALDVKNAAIHYHFATKEDLIRAVVKRYRDRFQLWVNNARVKDLSPEAKLDWFFSINDFRAESGKVCLVGSLEAEFNAIPDGLRQEAQALNTELLTWLVDTLNEGRAAGVFHFGGSAESKAALILSSVQGALQMARALGPQTFYDVVEQNKQDLLA